MEVQAYFDNIKKVILREISFAKNEIFIAVPWFTDNELLQAIINRAKFKTCVKLILLDDDINRQRGVDTKMLEDAGGKVYKIPVNEDSSLMHHKFCVIDRNVVITGSYNWSRQAQKNDENITVTKNNYTLSQQFINEFNRLIEHYFGEKATETTDTSQLVKRLQLIKGFIHLGDIDELPAQISKLSILTADDEVNEIIKEIEKQRYASAVIIIDRFVKRYEQLVVYEDVELQALRLEIKILEMQLVSIGNEKADVEKLVAEFGVRHNLALGEIICKILKLKIRLLESEIPDNEEKRKAFEEAKQDYEKYNEQYQQEKSRRYFNLTKEEKVELKRKYREAAIKCHPDKVAEELKVQAQELFSEMQKAYEENDLKRVTEILVIINAGGFSVSRSEQYTEKAKLKAEAARLRSSVERIILELNELKSSETFQTISTINDWGTYFAETKAKLEEHIRELEKKVGQLPV